MKIVLLVLSLLVWCQVFEQVKPPVSTGCNLIDFSTYDGKIKAQGGCTYYFFQEDATHRSVNNWFNYAGASKIITQLLTRQQYYAQLEVDNNNIGTSIFTNYNILTNTDYLINVYARANTGTGEIDVHGTNGLTEVLSGYCDDLVYDPANELATFHVPNTDFQLFSQEYAAYDNTHSGITKYSQIYVSPYWYSGAPRFITQFNYLQICPNCTGFKSYYDGPMPSGTTTFGNIFLGTAFYSAPVSLQPNVITTLDAYQMVQIGPETDLTATTNGYFIAEIIDCPTDGSSFIKPQYVNVSDGNQRTQQKRIFENDSSNAVSRISIYPNPANDIINIDLHKQTKWVDIKVINSLGILQKSIQSIDPKQQNIQIDIRDLSKGVYFIQFINNSGLLSTQKFIKK